MKIFLLWLKCLPPELYSAPLTTPFRLVCERVSVNGLAQVSSVFPPCGLAVYSCGRVTLVSWHFLNTNTCDTVKGKVRREHKHRHTKFPEKEKCVGKSHLISTRNSAPVMKQPTPGRVVEMLPFESAALGVLIHDKHIWCYHEPLLFGSAASQFLFRKSISVYCSSVCVCVCVAGMLGSCTFVCECINEGLHCCLGLARLSASDVLS